MTKSTASLRLYMTPEFQDKVKMMANRHCMLIPDYMRECIEQVMRTGLEEREIELTEQQVKKLEGLYD